MTVAVTANCKLQTPLYCAHYPEVLSASRTSAAALSAACSNPASSRPRASRMAAPARSATDAGLARNCRNVSAASRSDAAVQASGEPNCIAYSHALGSSTESTSSCSAHVSRTSSFLRGSRTRGQTHTVAGGD